AARTPTRRAGRAIRRRSGLGGAEPERTERPRDGRYARRGVPGGCARGGRGGFDRIGRENPTRGPAVNRRSRTASPCAELVGRTRHASSGVRLLVRLRLLRPTRLHALRLPLLLGEVRRPRRVAQAAFLVAARQVEQLLER